MRLLCFLMCFFLLVTCKESQYSKTSFNSFDNIKIAFTDEGNGEPILLIHGFISDGSSWNQTVLKDSLLKIGYRVIVPDLRGNGKSDKPQNSEAYANDAEIKDIKALADYLELDAFNCVGYSRGSIVLAKLLTQDSRINKAVLGGMGLDFTNPDWNRRIQFANAFSGRVKLTDETRGAVEYAKSVGADIKVLGFLQDHQPVTSIKELKSIKAKTLVIAGHKDLDNGNPAALFKTLPASKLCITIGDHNNTYKQTNFARAVINFLETEE